MTLYPNAPQRVRLEMVRCGYTIDSLSDRTQISTSVLRGILTGRAAGISTRNVCALARAFGYPTADFVDLLAQPDVYGPPRGTNA